MTRWINESERKKIQTQNLNYIKEQKSNWKSNLNYSCWFIAHINHNRRKICKMEKHIVIFIVLNVERGALWSYIIINCSTERLGAGIECSEFFSIEEFLCVFPKNEKYTNNLISDDLSVVNFSNEHQQFHSEKFLNFHRRVSLKLPQFLLIILLTSSSLLNSSPYVWIYVDWPHHLTQEEEVHICERFGNIVEYQKLEKIPKRLDLLRIEDI